MYEELEETFEENHKEVPKEVTDSEEQNVPVISDCCEEETYISGGFLFCSKCNKICNPK